MFQLHPSHCFSHALRFVFLEGERFRRCHRAKSAGARATIARDHHRSRALAPAFPAVRTLCAFANGMETQVGDERFGRKENRIGWKTHFDPRRFLRLVQTRIDFGAGHWVNVTQR
jgi:hypothetical protein